MLRCIRCGACLNACPVYSNIGGHAYPWVYSGPMGVVLTALAHGPGPCRDLLQASTLCRACSAVCPVMIDQPNLILKLRARASRTASRPCMRPCPMGRPVVRLSARLRPDTRLLKTSSHLAIDPDGQVRYGTKRLKKMGEQRRLPRLADKSYHRGKTSEDKP